MVVVRRNKEPRLRTNTRSPPEPPLSRTTRHLATYVEVEIAPLDFISTMHTI